MRIAYLVLGHKNPKQFNALLECLQHPNIDVFIHLDKKSDIKDELNCFPNLYFVKDADRIDIQWGKISMIDATLSLIKAMLDTENRYDYVYLISAQDMMIKKIDELYEYLNQNNKYNFIDILSVKDSRFLKYKKRVELYYPEWMISPNKIIILLKFSYIFLTGGLSKTWFKRKNNMSLPFAFGSQWWILTFECILEIYQLVEKHPEYLIYFKNTLVPDESFFQTMFCLSSHRNTAKPSLTFVDWGRNINHPVTFTMSDKDRLEQINDKFFARKFDENIDYKIIEYFKFKCNNAKGNKKDV